MADLDQGGGFPQYSRTWLGPTVGWAMLPIAPERIITSAAALVIQPFDSRILLNAAVVLVTLPDVISWIRAPFQANVSAFDRSLWIKDLGHNATANPVVVSAFGTQKIDGFSTFTIVTDGELIRLYPLSDLSGWFVG
jgi:hypothetical protein